MKHVTYAEKSLLVGDRVAELLMDYASLIGRLGQTDSVSIRAMGPDGNDVTATFLLNAGTIMMVESASTELANEPQNDLAEQYLQSRISELDSFEPPSELPELRAAGSGSVNGPQAVGEAGSGGNGSAATSDATDRRPEGTE